MKSFDLAPRVSYKFSVEGNPVLYVEGKDRSGKKLVKATDYLASLYSPFLQFYMRTNEDSPYEEIRAQTIDPKLDIYPENDRKFDVLVKLWDKMPLDEEYTHFDEANALITIPSPEISNVIVQDCRRRASDCGAEIEYDLSPIMGEIQMNVYFSTGWRFLQKIEVYGSKDEPDFPIDDEHYIMTYWSFGESKIHQFSITQVDPYYDYHFTLVPYDNIGKGIVFRKGYGYMCPQQEEPSCMVVSCIDFLAGSRGEDPVAIEQNTAFSVVNSEEPLIFDGFPIAMWQTATYSIQAKSDSGNTYFNEYYLTLNNAGELVNTSVGGEHMNMGASPLEFKVSHYITSGYCGLLLEVFGEGFANDRRNVYYGALVPSDTVVHTKAQDEAPFFVIEGTQVLNYSEISYIEIIYPNSWSPSIYNTYKKAQICTRKKIIIPSEWVGQPDTEYWEYTSILDSASCEIIVSPEEGVVKVRFHFPKFSTEPFAPNQEDAVVFNRDSDEYYLNIIDEDGSNPGLNWFPFRTSKIVSPKAQDRFLKIPVSDDLGGDVWMASACGVETYGLYPYQYSYPYRGVRPPQEPRDASGDWPLTDNSIDLFKNGWIMVGNIFNSSSTLKLQKLYFIVKDSSVADSVVSSKIRLEINRVSDNDEDIYYKTTEPAQHEDAWNGYSIISFSDLSMPYDGSSPEGWRLYAVQEDGSTYEGLFVRTVDKEEKLKDWQVRFLSSFNSKTKEKIPKKNENSPNSYFYTGKRIGAFAYADPYYQLKHPVVVKGFRTTF